MAQLLSQTRLRRDALPGQDKRAAATARVSDAAMGQAVPRVHLATLGRLGREPQPLYGHRAQGNSSRSSDARGARAAQPGKGTGGDGGPANRSPWPRRLIITPAYQLLRRSRTPMYQHGRLIAYDRHIASNRGHTVSSSHRQATGGTPNPEADGPARPSHRMLNRVLSWQQGTDSTRGLDNGAYHAVAHAGNRPIPRGTQGDRRTRVYGGTPGLYNFRPYGARHGYRGGPPPRRLALPGGPHRTGTLLDEGSPADGPQTFWPGEPWGLHTPTIEPLRQSLAVQRARYPQIRKPGRVRPLNSRRAGQTWGQQAVHLDGSQQVKVGTVKPVRQPGLNSRWRSQ
jgi:hypothetical protein